MRLPAYGTAHCLQQGILPLFEDFVATVSCAVYISMRLYYMAMNFRVPYCVWCDILTYSISF